MHVEVWNTDTQHSTPSWRSPEVMWSNCTPPNDTEELLQKLSDERALQLLPVFLFFALVFIIGLFGNSLTVYIYWTKFKATWSRTAIVALGIFDLMSCLIAVPGEVVDLRFSFNYDSDVMCRILRACSTFPSIASGIMLTTVAFDRYRLICTPLKSAASRRGSKKHVLLACGLSLLFTWPAALVYGSMKIDTGVGNVTGRECSTSDLVKNTPFPLVYGLVLSAVFVSACGAMIVFYSLIGRQVYRQGEFRKTLMLMRDRKRKMTQSDLEASLASCPDTGHDLSHGDCSEQNCSNSSAADRSETRKEEAAEVNGEAAVSQQQQQQQPSSPTATPSSTSPAITSPTPLRRKVTRAPSLLQRLRKKGSADSSDSSRTRKTTLMLCFISFVFILSYLPHLLVKLIRTLDKEFLKEADPGRLVAYNLCARSYFLNSFANVFIYGFCSLRFRKECSKVLRKLFCWKPCRR